MVLNPRHDDQAFTELDSLTTPDNVSGPEEQMPPVSFSHSVIIDQSMRDRLMIMLLHAFQQTSSQTPSLHSFPSSRILTELFQLSFVQQTVGIDSWIYPEIKNRGMPSTVLIAALVANGAIQSPLSAVHKFGFALQEALRIKMYSLYDNDNSLARDLNMHQALLLGLQMGLWSGQSRKIDVAESFTQPSVTMLRRAGRFRSTQYSTVLVKPTDHGSELMSKWDTWKREESFKRLVIHLIFHDAQASMALLANPLISEAEMQLPLPSTKSLWSAKTPAAWKAHLLSSEYTSKSILPSLADCIHDISNLTSVVHSVDFFVSALAVLHGYWGLIWDYRQLVSLHNCTSNEETSTSRLIITSRQHELSQILGKFRQNVVGHLQGLSSNMIVLILELLTMYLHVSMEDLQLFAGKEGVEDSRRVFPRLRLWVQERDSKQSV